MSGAAVARIGTQLSAQSYAVPQGAKICGFQEALSAQPGTDKPVASACGKAVMADHVWRRAMLGLAAYSSKLESLAHGADRETAGKLEAAMSGVNDANWIQVEGAQEQAARDAIAQLFTQLKTNTSKGDLAQTVKESAPQVKVLCDGLSAYLDTQVKAISDIQADVEKKKAARGDRRCGTVDNKSVCVGESFLDRMVYGNLFGDLTSIENSHLDARDNVATFCAAHRKLEDAAANNRLSNSKTYQEIIDAVQAVPRSQPHAPTVSVSTSAAPSGGSKSDKK